MGGGRRGKIDWRAQKSNSLLPCNGDAFTLNDESEVSSSVHESPSNAFAYQYPSVELQEISNPGMNVELSESDSPMILVDSDETRIVAYVDRTPCSKSLEEYIDYGCESGSALGDSSHRGLGFVPSEVYKGEGKDEVACNSSSDDEECYVKEEQSRTGKSRQVDFDVTSSSDRNAGFLSIGGLHLYTEDINTSEDDDGLAEDGGSETVDSSSSDSDASPDNELSDGTLSDIDDSDIDEELVYDYIEGIGGDSELLNTDWLLKCDLSHGSPPICITHNYDDESRSMNDSGMEKLHGAALEKASMEYGLKKKKSRKRGYICPHIGKPVFDSGLLSRDNLDSLKDQRALRKREHMTHLSKSWTRSDHKSRKPKDFSDAGSKKKLRKKIIALKRHERMIHRGVDLDKINLKLRQMVIDEVDMLSFQPMHGRDCSQVQRIASIYHLKSGRQGSGKKRFVVVTRTEQTRLPLANDKLRLEKLLRCGIDLDDFCTHQEPDKGLQFGRRRKKMVQSNSHLSSSSTGQLQAKSPTNHLLGDRTSSTKRTSKRATAYADQPVFFVSSGTMRNDSLEDTNDNLRERNPPIADSSKIGEFEIHTKGIGSKIMVKMGFVEGNGLGKTGQGISQPIEAIRRQKSLGLGAEVTDLNRTKFEDERIGAFEKHTRGFGSKMMDKMGFVNGTGLGKNGKGIMKPLSAVKLPRSRGLGA